MSTEPDAPPSDDDATRQDEFRRGVRGPDFPDPKWAANWTEEARGKALEVFARITQWYSDAATSYAFGPGDVRKHRDRMLALARIMRATLFAHVHNDESFLHEFEIKAQAYLRSKEGQNATGSGIVVIGGDILDGKPSAETVEHKWALFFHGIWGGMTLLSFHVDDYAPDHTDGARWIARELAQMFVYKYFDLYSRDLDAERKADEASVALVAKAMQRNLEKYHPSEWGSKSIRLIFHALKSLGHRDPKSFISYLEKNIYEKPLYVFVRNDKRVLRMCEDPEGKIGSRSFFQVSPDDPDNDPAHPMIVGPLTSDPASLTRYTLFISTEDDEPDSSS